MAYIVPNLKRLSLSYIYTGPLCVSLLTFSKLALSAGLSLSLSFALHFFFPQIVPLQNNSRHVVVLADPSFSTDRLMEGLSRMRIVPPSLASIVGITSLSPLEAKRLASKSGLTVPLLSDEKKAWMSAHGMAIRSLRSIMFILDAKTGSVLKIIREPAPGAVNDYLIETIGDWRGQPGGIVR